MQKAPVVALKSIRDRVSEAEWETRVDLAACYRLVARYAAPEQKTSTS